MPLNLCLSWTCPQGGKAGSLLGGCASSSWWCWSALQVIRVGQAKETIPTGPLPLSCRSATPLRSHKTKLSVTTTGPQRGWPYGKTAQPPRTAVGHPCPVLRLSWTGMLHPVLSALSSTGQHLHPFRRGRSIRTRPGQLQHPGRGEGSILPS